MKIIFVMGFAGSGKSTYIKEQFKDMKVLDLYDYQENCWTYDTVWDSYMRIKDDLIEAIKNNEDVVMEHTLLKAIRRKIYIDAVREVTDCPISIVFVNPTREVLKERRKKRGLNFGDKNIDMEMEVLEAPSLEEGFDKIDIVL